MNEEPRAIELEVVVPGTPEQVWQAIATGPGISSWYVPTTLEERAGGALTQRFGEGPGMTVHGRVAAWEPGRRVVMDGGEGVPGLAFEWLVEARDAGTCVVRLVNSGFGAGAEWDGQYDAMAQGWLLFLDNLRLHLTHFAGQAAAAMLPLAMWAGPRSATWAAVTSALGLPAEPAPGERVSGRAGPSLAFEGTVAEASWWRMTLLLDSPAPGVGVLAVEGDGEAVGVSLWFYLHGPHAADLVARDEPQWRRWLTERAMPTPDVSGQRA